MVYYDRVILEPCTGIRHLFFNTHRHLTSQKLKMGCSLISAYSLKLYFPVFIHQINRNFQFDSKSCSHIVVKQ